MTVQAAAAKNGVLASFMPKPLAEKNGSGLHVNVSLNHSGRNLFGKKTMPPEAEYFIAGILNRAREITAFTNPLRNSYKRFGCFEAPKYLSWSPQGRNHLIRMPAADEPSARIELRSPDPSCNHYFAIALTLAAGIEGINNKTEPPAFCDFDPYAADESRVKKLETLPATLDEAIALAEKSEFVKSVLSPETAAAYLELLGQSREPPPGAV
jgi:glutamine synthetase